MWRLYRQHQRDGLLHMNMFGLNTVLIGDFDTLKQVFSLSETTNRLTGTGIEDLGREDRRIKGEHYPGDNIINIWWYLKNIFNLLALYNVYFQG